MLTHCPICRALLDGADTCRRCRTEVGGLREVERRGRALAGRAMQLLAAGESDRALHLLRRSLVVHATPEIRWLAAKLGAAPPAPRSGSRPPGSEMPAIAGRRCER